MQALDSGVRTTAVRKNMEMDPFTTPPSFPQTKKKTRPAAGSHVFGLVIQESNNSE